MFKHYPADERGTSRTSWLNSRHSFSFGQYHDRERMGFRTLRVINDDVVEGGGGFGEHGHRDMEIISYVVEGGLEHRDSLGNGGVIRPGDVQLMSAGKGIRHAEFNASESEKVRFLQIWIPPSQAGIEAGYQQQKFPLADEPGRLHLLVDPDGRDGALKIHQDARLYGGRFRADDKTAVTIGDDRHAWVQIVRGSIDVNGHTLSEGDGAAISDENELVFTDPKNAEVLLFDLA